MLIEIRKLKLDIGPHSVLRDVSLTLQKGQIWREGDAATGPRGSMLLEPVVG